MAQVSEDGGGLEEQLLQPRPELTANQAVQHGVEAAVGVRQAHRQRERVGLRVVEGLAEGHEVKLYQHSPQRQRLIGKPAQEEREDHDHDGFGHFGAPALSALLDLRGRRARDSPSEDQAQEQQVAHGDYDEGDEKAQQDLLQLVQTQ